MADFADGDWRKSPPEVKRIFDKQAVDGYFTKQAFTELMEVINPSMSDEQVEAEFDIADASRAGKLSYDDFYVYFVKWDEMKEESKDAVVMKGALSSSAVYVRVRPLAESGGHAAGEKGDYEFKGFSEKTNEITMTNRDRPTTFKFPRKVLSECSQQEMYDTMMPDLVNSMILRQMDVMFLAYGQTGTGKTHTMFGPPESLQPDACPPDGPHPEWGIFPRIVDYTLSTIKSATRAEIGSTLNIKVTVSAMEFYMMGAFDLLNSQVPVFIEDGRPVGLTEQEVHSSKDVSTFLMDVYGNRHVRKTKMNEGSSRSHTALILKVYFCDSKGGDFSHNSFTLFDLAGAERVGKTGGKFISPMDAMAAVAKGKDPGTGGEGAIINWDLSCMMDQVQKATDCANKKRPYKVGTALITPAIQTIASCFDGRALMGMVVCVSQAPQHGSETWFSCTMGERLASLRSRVQARKMRNIADVIKECEDKLKKVQKNLKDKPKHKFAMTWTAQATGLQKELAVLAELKKYDPSRDQVSVFVRKQLGLFANTEGSSEDEQKAAVRAVFEEADTNKDQVLSFEEIVTIFSKLQRMNIDREDLEVLYKQMDKNKDGKVSYDEFFNYLFKKD
eukprot:TRINITY_DN28247_c0_g4_i1.p1 TRINITY_DN28247_c0_g4~~TRINITY_DN28247_c0_g4_i1.p1  ORF type:complete len:616 (+),score=104.98 TRINITY_DN28247_c0_g4_i1:321-2168(+)